MNKKGMANFKVVVFDETKYWAPELVGKAGGKIYASYLFDSGSITYCCEITPSYHLRHLFSTPLQDDENGEVAAEIREAEVGNDNDRYVHCHVIDAHLDKTLVHDFGLDLVGGETDLTREDLLEEYMEWCRGNGGGLEFPPAHPVQKVVV